MAETDKWEPLVITEDGDKTEEKGENRTEPRPESQREGQNTQRSASQREEAPLTRTEEQEQDREQNECENEKAVEKTREPPTQEDHPCKPEQDPAEEGTQQDTKKAHRLSPEFPDALFELLCTLQEGRRLNDQRCSFTALEPAVRRRRCHSEPNTTKPANRVVFSSMTSLQKEEFFDLVATAQARRLNDQRAQLERSPPPKPKSRSFRGSIRQLTLVKKTPEPVPAPAPAPVPKEELYSMILHTQAQGRLEDQRSRAPGPMDDEVFFSLLLRVQGGRMDEQRTELPCMLHT